MRCDNCAKHGYICESQPGNADCERCDRVGERCSLRKYRKNGIVGYTTSTKPVASGADFREEQSFDATMSDRMEDGATNQSFLTQPHLSMDGVPSGSGQDYGSSLNVGGQIGEMREFCKAHSKIVADRIAETEEQQANIERLKEALHDAQKSLQKYQSSVSMQQKQLESLRAECSSFGAYLSGLSE